MGAEAHFITPLWGTGPKSRQNASRKGDLETGSLTGPDQEGLRTIEEYLETETDVQPHVRNAMCGSLQWASLDVLPRHNKKGSSMASTVLWHQHDGIRFDPSAPRKPPNDMSSSLGEIFVWEGSDGGGGLRPSSVSAADRLEARRTPLRGPKGLHSIALGKKPLPKSHDIILSITANPVIIPEDESAQPDSRFPPGDNQFRIVGVGRLKQNLRGNLRGNRTVPAKHVTGAIHASSSNVPWMEETIRTGQMIPATRTNLEGGPKILPPESTVQALMHSLPRGLLREDRKEHRSILDCMKPPPRPETSCELRLENTNKALSALTGEALETQWAESKIGRRNGIKINRGIGNPVTWQTPRFKFGKEVIDVAPVPIPEENLRLRTAGPARRRPPQMSTHARLCPYQDTMTSTNEHPDTVSTFRMDYILSTFRMDYILRGSVVL